MVKEKKKRNTTAATVNPINLNPKELYKEFNAASPYAEDIKKLEEKIKKSTGFWKNFHVEKLKIIRKIEKKIMETKYNIFLGKNLKDTHSRLKKKALLDFKGWKRELTDKHKASKTILINMELRNGVHIDFLVVLGKEMFDYDSGTYIIDDDYKYYLVSSKIYCLDYHQDCSLPLKRKFKLNEIRETMVKSQYNDVAASINPTTLKTFLISEVIQKAISGKIIEDFMRFIKIFLIINTCGIGFILFMIMRKG